MAIKYTIEKHAVAAPAKVLAREGGKHIYNVKLTEAVDNGNFIGRNEWLGLDCYKQTTAGTGFEGVVREQAANGNYYVEVVAPGTNVLFVYNVPMIAEEWTNNFKKESNFYNEKDEIVRAYELAIGDVLEISEEGFTAKPTVGKSVEVSGKKLAVKGE